MPDDSAGRDEPKLRAATAARRRLLLMLGVAELQHVFRKLSPWMHRAIGVALAMAFSTLIEQTKLLDGFEDAVVREVARQRSLANEMAAPEPGSLQIQQIEISAQARVSGLEQKEGVDGVIERLGGVAPIRRIALADVLDELGRQLPTADAGKDQILAIDIDLAPLEAKATAEEEVDAMLSALGQLRQHAHVIAVVLPRSPGTEGGRRERNEFLRRAGCTRLNPAASDTAHTHALFFASPRLFHAKGSYPTKFPYQRDEGHDLVRRTANGDAALPPHFPSLGTLIHLQFTHRFAHREAAAGAAEAGRDQEVSSARQSLTTLCEQAFAPRSGDELLEDRMATGEAEAIAQAYQQRRYSWRLLDDPSLQHTLIERVKPKGWAAELGPGVLSRPVLLLGIDGGTGYDKFGIAGISDESLSGAALHALQALSIEKRTYPPLLEKFAGMFVDAFLALMYWLAWEKWLRGSLSSVRKRMPIIGGWLVVGVPLVLGVFLTWVCIRFAAVAMGIDLWINPIYIVAGLLLAMYADAWNESDSVTEEERKLRSRLLGLPAARDALRSGFGSRVESAHFAATSSYLPVTGMDELRVQAEVVRSRLGAAALADAVLSALLRVLVLCAGWAIIVYELIKAGSL